LLIKNGATSAERLFCTRCIIAEYTPYRSCYKPERSEVTLHYGNRYIIKGSATGAKSVNRSLDKLEVTLHYGNRPIFFKEQFSVV